MSFFKFSIISNVIFILCLCWVSVESKKNYCSLCDNHTMCKYKGLGSNCANPGGYGVTENEKRDIVDSHNYLRRLVARGQETAGKGGGQPKGSNMMKMRWDEDLAEVAQRWADQCRFQHDTCRDDERWKVGQNIFWKWKHPNHFVNWTEAMISWYSEVKLFNPRNVKSFQFDPETGHYTQMLWHDTHMIGCGRRDYGPNKIYVCNYGPAGNWIDQPMYEIGEPCSKCPSNTVCRDSLCDLSTAANQVSNKDRSPIKIPFKYQHQVFNDLDGNEKGSTSINNEIDDGLSYYSEMKKAVDDIKIRIQKMIEELRRKGKIS